MIHRYTGPGVISHSSAWYSLSSSSPTAPATRRNGSSTSRTSRLGSRRCRISIGSISRPSSRSIAVAAIRPALAGSTPCQPGNGLMPLNSSGRNIISTATYLVTYPITPAISGIDAYSSQWSAISRQRSPGTGVSPPGGADELDHAVDPLPYVDEPPVGQRTGDLVTAEHPDPGRPGQHRLGILRQLRAAPARHHQREPAARRQRLRDPVQRPERLGEQVQRGEAADRVQAGVGERQPARVAAQVDHVGL